jgi:hypothetical protein
MTDAQIQSGWMPIETAPKDGTVFIAWGAPYRYLAEWSKHDDGWVCSADGDPPEQLYLPTLWHPLPAPPIAPAPSDTKD